MSTTFCRDELVVLRFLKGEAGVGVLTAVTSDGRQLVAAGWQPTGWLASRELEALDASAPVWYTYIVRGRAPPAREERTRT